MTSDHPRVTGDVGKAGVAIDTIDDMKILFDGIPLDEMSVSMTMNGAVIPILAFFIVAGEEQGVPQAKLDGTIQNDILKEFMVRNTYIYPAPPPRCGSFPTSSPTPRRICRSSIRSRSPAITCRKPGRRRFRSSPSPSPTAATMPARRWPSGLDIDAFAGRLSFFFAIGMNFFMEVAKLRAARKLWHRVMTDLGARDERSKMLRTHCQTSGVSLTEQDPYNNVIRTTVEAMAAALGGTQSLHTNALDEAIALPTDFSARIARNTQLVLQEETGITHVVDPLGGSYYVEALTQELHDKAWEIIERVEAEGGMAKAVAAGWPKAMIEKPRRRAQPGSTATRMSLLGSTSTSSPSRMRSTSSTSTITPCATPRLRASGRVKAGRNEDACQAALAALREGRQGQ